VISLAAAGSLRDLGGAWRELQEGCRHKWVAEDSSRNKLADVQSVLEARSRNFSPAAGCRHISVAATQVLRVGNCSFCAAAGCQRISVAELLQRPAGSRSF
jgi:hypothetical protein